MWRFERSQSFEITARIEPITLNNLASPNPRYGDAIKDFADKNVSLHGGQALAYNGSVYTEPKHRPRIAGCFGFNYDLAHRGSALRGAIGSNALARVPPSV
jgi:hypothetical protein